MRVTISIENKVAMSLQRLGTGNILCTIGEVCGVVEGISLEILRKFYNLIRVDL